MKTMIPLRVIAICSNIAFITYALLGLRYGVFGRVYPILVLHAAFLPLNLVRLRQLKELLRAVREASEDETIRSLVPYMQTDTRAAGDVLFEKGDPADRLYIIRHGRVRFPQIGKVLSDGDVFGEVGLFGPHTVRTLSATCDGDCALYTITRGQGPRALLPESEVRVFPHPAHGGHPREPGGGRGAGARVAS